MNAGQRWAEVKIVPYALAQDRDMMQHLTAELAGRVIDGIHDAGHEVAGDVKISLTESDPAFWPAPRQRWWVRLMVKARLRKPPPAAHPPLLLRVEAASRARKGSWS